MAFERSSSTKTVGDSLDSFVSKISQSYSNQVSIRNAEDETRFNKAVLEDNISLSDQLAFRKSQLKDVSDDPAEVTRIRGEISSLTDQIEQKTFSDAYTQKIIDYNSGMSSIDSVISWLTDQAASVTDPTIKATVQSQLAQKQSEKFTLTQQMLHDQTQYAINDKSSGVISDQIDKVSSAKVAATLAGNDAQAASLDLQLQALKQSQATNSIETDLKNFAVSSISGAVGAVNTLNAYNSKISSASSTGPVTIGGTTYGSAQEFWTFKRNSYLADDSSSTGFFGQLGNEVSSNIKTANSQNILSKDILAKDASTYDSLLTRPELAPYANKIINEKATQLQVGADLISGKVLNSYQTDYDLTKAVSSLNSLKSLGVDTSDAYTKVLTFGGQLKQNQVDNILKSAQSALQNDPSLTPEAAISQAVAAGAGTVLSPEQLATKNEGDIATQGAATANQGTGVNDPRTTLPPTATPGSNPSAIPTPAVPVSTYQGNSIVDFLSSTGQKSDISSRKALASKNGISNYTGTAAQNTELLNILRAASAPPTQANSSATHSNIPTSQSPSTPSYGTSLVRLNSNNQYDIYADGKVINTISDLNQANAYAKSIATKYAGQVQTSTPELTATLTSILGRTPSTEEEDNYAATGKVPTGASSTTTSAPKSSSPSSPATPTYSTPSNSQPTTQSQPASQSQAPAQAPASAPKTSSSAYTYNKLANGNVEIYQNGQRFSTASVAIAKSQYGYSGN